MLISVRVRLLSSDFVMSLTQRRAAYVTQCVAIGGLAQVCTVFGFCKRLSSYYLAFESSKRQRSDYSLVIIRSVWRFCSHNPLFTFSLVVG